MTLSGVSGRHGGDPELGPPATASQTLGNWSSPYRMYGLRADAPRPLPGNETDGPGPRRPGSRSAAWRERSFGRVGSSVVPGAGRAVSSGTAAIALALEHGEEEGH